MPDLNEDRRKQLDGIVSQMVSNGEGDDAIHLVVNDFKGKYSAEQPKSTPTSSPLGEAARGFWQFTNPIPMARRLLGADQNPVTDLPPGAIPGVPSGVVNTGMDLIRGQVDEGKKAFDLAKRGRYSEAAGHGLASLIPILGPAAARIGDTLAGNPERPPQEMLPDEQPSSPNPARAVGMGTALALPFVVKGVANATKPIQQSGVSALEEGAVKSYSRALGPTTKGNKVITERVAPKLIERGVMAATRSGLQNKALSGVELAARELEDAYQNLPSDSSVPLKAIQDRILQSANDSFAVPTPAKNMAGTPAGQVSMSPLADVGLKQAKGLADRLVGVAVKDPTTGDLVVPIEAARRFRQFYDNVAAKAGRYEGKPLADYSVAEAHGMAADAIRTELAKAFPDINAINKEFSFWKDVSKVIGDTITRTSSQARPLSEQLATVAGGAAGFTKGGALGGVKGAGAMRSLMQLVRSPGWNTISAIAKDRMAQALAKGDVTGLQKIIAANSAGAAVENVVRSFPASQLDTFAQQNGVTPDQARQRLEAEGWRIQ